MDKIEKYWVYEPNGWPNPIITFEKLKEELPFIQGRVFVYGKWHDERRLTCFYGEKSYNYSGRIIEKNHPPKGSLIGEMFEVINNEEFRENLIEKHPELKGILPKFNAVLCNLYRGKNTRDNEELNKCDSIGPHADDEKSLKSSVILSISFGAVRKFRFRKFNEKSGWTWEKKLQAGSILVMLPGCQKHYKHFVPEEKRVKEDRINLTFRSV